VDYSSRGGYLAGGAYFVVYGNGILRSSILKLCGIGVGMT